LAEPFCEDVYITRVPNGIPSIKPRMKVSIPPALGPRSFVINKTFFSL
jgi:hypothetical protein